MPTGPLALEMLPKSEGGEASLVPDEICTGETPGLRKGPLRNPEAVQVEDRALQGYRGKPHKRPNNHTAKAVKYIKRTCLCKQLCKQLSVHPNVRKLKQLCKIYWYAHRNRVDIFLLYICAYILCRITFIKINIYLWTYFHPDVALHMRLRECSHMDTQ